MTAPIDADALLAGPRGRRLCLELMRHGDPASEAREHFGQLVFFASYRSAKANGVAVTLLRSSTADGPGADAPLPDPTPAELADALDRVPLPHLDDDTLTTALASTVDAAAYWQEPDGDDLLMVEPVVTRALRRVAEHVVSSPATAWWSDRTAPDQHLVEFDRPEFRTGEPPSWSVVGVRSALQQWRDARVAGEARALRERPLDPSASFSADWWSTPNWIGPVTTQAGPDGAPLGLRLVEDGFGDTRAHVRQLDVPPDARVIEVDGPDDWARLCREHPLEVTASHRHDWYRATGRAGAWVSPDWASVAEIADAVHVSVAGYLLTAGRSVPVDESTASVLAGWSPDETYWLTDVAASDAPAITWVLDDDGRWVREARGAATSHRHGDR